MATVVWDSKGIILIDYKPAGTSVTGEYYANVIKQLRVAIKEKRRGKLAAGVLLFQCARINLRKAEDIKINKNK